MAAYVYWFAGSLPVILLLGKQIALLTIGITLLGDTFAAIVGVGIGRHRLPTNLDKTWEGTIAGALTAFLVAFFLSILLSLNPPSLSFSLSLIGAIVFALVDVPVLPVDDNFLMPLVVGLALQAAFSLQTGRFL